MDKKEYRYELHCHTSDVSRCAVSSTKEAIDYYVEKGYDGIVITEHYSPQTFRFKKAFFPHKYIDEYVKSYKIAKSYAPKDFTVLFGCELRFFFTIDDFLIYGLDEEFLRKNGNLMIKYLKKIFHLCEKENLLLIEAHPYRIFRTRHNPKYLHGCEVFNGKQAGHNTNIKAEIWAKKCSFDIITSGGDFHNKSKTYPAGIITNEPIKTNEDLLRILKNKEYKLIK